MAKIVKVIGREIIDSRGNPTVEADVYLDDGSMGPDLHCKICCQPVKIPSGDIPQKTIGQDHH